MQSRYSDRNLFSQPSMNEGRSNRSRLNVSISQNEQSYDVLDFEGPIPRFKTDISISYYKDEEEVEKEAQEVRPPSELVESKMCFSKAAELTDDIISKAVSHLRKKLCISQNAVKMKKVCTLLNQEELDLFNEFEYGNEGKGDEVADDIPTISFLMVSTKESDPSVLSKETFRSMGSEEKTFQKDKEEEEEEEEEEFVWPTNKSFEQNLGLEKIQEFVQTQNSVLSCWSRPISVTQEDLSTVFKYVVTWSRRTRRRAVPVVVAVVYFLVVQSNVPAEKNEKVQVFYQLEGHYSFERAVVKNQIPQNELLMMMRNKIKILRKYPV